MRNRVIQEKNDYLANFKSVGTNIGAASFQGLAGDNVALGQFV
jgi:hypothetical protein